MKIAIEGCAHGDLENIYDSLHILEQKNGFKVDLLICCGDFQSSRNEDDLMCMAVPPKFKDICSFYKYYSGERVSPVLTIFIGGNHEASNYLQELPYGGWVAPNIYYLGYAGVINVAGLRIAGLSGIYKGHDFLKGHYEKSPYSENSKRTVYHVRNLEVFRMKQLSGKIDIFLSHDWPTEVVKFGNIQQLLKRKPFFKEDIDKGELGSKPNNEILYQLKPTYWFSAHLHCKFAALIQHTDNSVTKFLGLDKCLPKRRFLQVLDLPHNRESKIEINYDIEWLTILYLTNHLLSVRNTLTYMPGPGINERYDFTPTEEEKNHVLARFNGNLVVPKTCYLTASVYNPNSSSKKPKQPEPVLNPQTVTFCELLAVDDPLTQVCKNEGVELNVSVDLNSTISFIDDTLDSANSSVNSSQSTPMKKLSSFNLPEPKLDESDSEEIESKDIPTEESEVDPLIKIDDNKTAVLHNETDKTEDNKTAVLQNETDKNRNSPTPKKFKRRNEGFYSTDNKDK